LKSTAERMEWNSGTHGNRMRFEKLNLPQKKNQQNAAESE